jgi:2'-5' RNA ligase
MNPSEEVPTKTALLLTVPAAGSVAERHRRHLDPAARDGIPAHVTVLFPFVRLDGLTEQDHSRLEVIAAAQRPFELEGRRVAWFGDRVVYVEVAPAEPVADLMSQVIAEFPDHPPYAGAIPVADVVPHLTVGDGGSPQEMRAASREVEGILPFTQLIDSMELWAGPTTAGRSAPAPWRRVRSYRLGSGR